MGQPFLPLNSNTALTLPWIECKRFSCVCLLEVEDGPGGFVFGQQGLESASVQAAELQAPNLK